MKESAPSWEGGDSGVQDNDFQCKYLMEAFRTIFKNPALLKSNADGASEFWEKLGKLGGQRFEDKEFPADKKSLITDWRENNDDVKESAADWGDIEWIRATEIPELNDKDGKLAIF